VQPIRWPALSVAGASRAAPCSVSTPPLIEPDGRISRIRLSEEAHAFAHGTLSARSCSWTSPGTIPSRLRVTPSATPEPLPEVLGASATLLRSFVASCVRLQPRPLPSTGVTRLHRYYEPLRHPSRPGLSPSRASGWERVCSRRLGFPVLSEVSCRLHAVAYTPAGTRAAKSLMLPPALAAFPGDGSGRLLHYQFRGLIGCSLALRPARSRIALWRPLRRRLRRLRYLHRRSDCYRLERPSCRAGLATR